VWGTLSPCAGSLSLMYFTAEALTLSITWLATDRDTAAATTDGGLWSANLADWLAGMGTVATAAISVFLLWRERGDRERQRDREALAEDTARRRQASRVNLGVPQRVSATGRTDDFWEVVYAAELNNDSDETISDVVVRVVLLKGDGSQAVRIEERTPRIAPGTSTRADTPLTKLPWADGPDTEGSWSEAEFTDAAGLRWRRDAQHRLSEISPLPVGRVSI
jgi:hypothetical protein